MRKLTCLGAALAALWLCGCRTYQSSEFDRYRSDALTPGNYKRAATMGFRDPLFHEALNVSLMNRGIEVVERQKLYALVQEQQMADSKFVELADREKAFKLGKMVNADVIFYGDDLFSTQRYEYAPAMPLTLFLPIPIYGTLIMAGVAGQKTMEANKTGVVQNYGGVWFDLYAYCSSGATLRAVDTRTGEIVWVGYGIKASCQKVTAKNLRATSTFGVVVDLVGSLLDDFMGTGG